MTLRRSAVARRVSSKEKPLEDGVLGVDIWWVVEGGRFGCVAYFYQKRFPEASESVVFSGLQIFRLQKLQ